MAAVTCHLQLALRQASCTHCSAAAVPTSWVAMELLA
eukprot:CAMPEP_0202908314 /NCGR_PEP_ID=MMETSP1392-20130828/45644_1 /ASSEMBLY_ACC=CAM_ASM_000868 /TAXON_ID=225041 /ORGANISM="Chlamydomonas chlamydogama, Strain SAG 11-48b" /LENGTH=36 /DNA_ID= /DNA_START= /DNA_END= /DNA_ORIENTATION=